jgi:hypothetical protein
LLALCAGSGCSWTLDLDGYRSRTGVEGAVGSLEDGDAGATRADATTARDTAGPFRDYRFPRGAASFSVAAAEGLLSTATAEEGLALTAGSFPTARGGTVEVATDGSFTFTPAGAPGTFWGTDLLEYRLPTSVLRARITVYPDRLRLAELATSGGGGFGIAGAHAEDNLGGIRRCLAPAGDVNGDGLEDIVLGLHGPNVLAPDNVQYGEGNGAYVLFGAYSTSNVLLATPAAGAGFLVQGDSDSTTLDSFGTGVAPAGDVNGDGFDDVIVTSHGRGLARAEGVISGTPYGAAYVVFGKPDTNTLDISALLSAGGGVGFSILGSDQDAFVGYSAAGAGDVNGDGLADLIVSVPYLDLTSGVFVIFGKSDSLAVSLSSVADGRAGFAVLGEPDGERLGFTVAGVGDVNGDGLDDIAFASSYQAPGDLLVRGRVRVVLGRRDPAPSLSLASLDADPSLGYAITGAADGDLALDVQAGRDVNGDGLDDVLVAAQGASRSEPAAPADDADAGVTDDASSPAPPLAQSPDGIVYVVQGRSSPVDILLSDIERGDPAGFAISGSTPAGNVGASVSSGDIDADGHADVIVGTAPANRAEAYVVFGTPKPISVRLGLAPTEQALKIEGNVDEYAAARVASGADINGDGLDDLLVGAALYGGAGTPQLAGGAYVAFGWDVRGTLSGRGEAMLGDRSDNVFDLPALPPLLVRGGHGNDTLRAGSQTPVVDLRARGRWESIEVIDVRGGGPHRVLLDEVALRRIPENQQGFAFSLARRLTVLGDAEDTLELEATGFQPRGGNAGRTVYGKAGVYYGLELSPEMTLIPGAAPR